MHYDPSKRQQPFVYRQGVIPEDLNLIDSSTVFDFNPLNAELYPICHLLALLEAHHIFRISGLKVKQCTGCIEMKTEAGLNILF
jgi:hypothetical protein